MSPYFADPKAVISGTCKTTNGDHGRIETCRHAVGWLIPDESDPDRPPTPCVTTGHREQLPLGSGQAEIFSCYPPTDCRSSENLLPITTPCFRFESNGMRLSVSRKNRWLRAPATKISDTYQGVSHLADAFFWCARHGADLGGESPLRALVTGTASRRQLRRREAGWGGSRRRTLEPTNRNRIRGRCGGVTRQWTGTPDAHPDTRTGKSGGDQGKGQRLTLGDLPASPGDPEQEAGDGLRRVGRSQPRP